jgi:hypothetical protein
MASRLSLLFAAAFLALVAGIQPSAAQDEAYYRMQKKALNMRHFHLKEFDAIERLHRQYLTERTRTKSGVWELGLLHEGLTIDIWNMPGTIIKDGSMWNGHFAEWEAAYPRSEALHLMKARIPIAIIDDVIRNAPPQGLTQDQARLVREQLDNAEAYIRRHRPADAQDPYWDQLNIRIAIRRGMNRADFDRMLREAVTRHPSYFDLYFQAVTYYVYHADDALRAIEALARDAAMRSRETEGLSAYARVMWSGSGWMNAPTFKKLVDWPLMKRSFDDILARYPDDWNRAALARFACWAGDRKKAAEILPKLQNAHIAGIWQGSDAYLECRRFALGEKTATR